MSLVSRDYQNERSLNKEDLEREGRRLYNVHTVMRDIGEVMEHPLFRDFFSKYFSDWNSGEAMLMLMRTYEEIDQGFGDEFTPYQKLALLHKVMLDGRTRKIVMDNMVEYKTSSNNSKREQRSPQRSSLPKLEIIEEKTRSSHPE